MRLAAANEAISCDEALPEAAVAMGGDLDTGPVWLRIEAEADQSPLGAVEGIKGYLEEGTNELREEVVTVWRQKEGASTLCTSWQDPTPSALAFYYARVKQVPTPRWTNYLCERFDRCDELSKTSAWIQERAWTSPVWVSPR